MPPYRKSKEPGKGRDEAVSWRTWKTDGLTIRLLRTTAFVLTVVVKTTKKGAYVRAAYATVPRGKDTTMAARMTVVENLDVDRLTDLLLKKMESKFLRMPKEWRDTVRTGYVLPPVQIALKEPQDHNDEFHSHYWIMELYVSHNGGLTMRVKDEWGRQILERAFL